MKKAISLILCLSLIFSLSLFAFAGDEGVAVSRLSVCVNGDSASSKGFCWYTKTKTDTVVEIYKDGVNVTDELEFSSVVCKEFEGSFMHKAVVNGLQSGCDYTYRVGNGSVFSDYGTFSTDDGDDKISFIAIADVQASSKENFDVGARTLKTALETMDKPDFVANMGDFTNDSTNEEWDLYYDSFGELQREITLAPVAGNHDGLGVWNWFSNMFCLDESESVQSLNGVNYSFDYGNAHFSVLNTNDLLSISISQLKWLKNDLASTDKDWKIVFMHKSPYTLGKDGKWPDALYLQKSLTKVLDEGNADVVFSGHDHMYLRTKALKNNKLDESGTTYVLSGTAGSKRYEVRDFLADSFLKTDFVDALTVQKNGYGNYWSNGDWSGTSEDNIGSCFNTISIDATTLTLSSYIVKDKSENESEKTVTKTDSFVIEKQTGENKKTFTKDNSTNAFDYGMQIMPSFSALAFYTFFNWLPRFIHMLPRLVDTYVNKGVF